MDQNIEGVLSAAVVEIRTLRRRNEILQAKVDTMELFALVFTSQPNYGVQGDAEDIAYAIDTLIIDLKE